MRATFRNFGDAVFAFKVEMGEGVRIFCEVLVDL